MVGKDKKTDYFFGIDGADEFTFYRIPKLLITLEKYASLSIEAKFLYGLLLDRMQLSSKNHWVDEEGKVYIVFTIDAVMEVMRCADNKATKLMADLESFGLIERKRQGMGKPNIVYVKRFFERGGECDDSQYKNRENHESRIVKITNQESLKSRCNNTEYNNTEYNNTEILSTNVDNKERKNTRTMKPFKPPTIEEISAYVREKNVPIDPVAFYDYFEAGDWFDSEGKPVLNWKQRVLTWSRMQKERKPTQTTACRSSKPFTYDYSDTEGSL